MATAVAAVASSTAESPYHQDPTQSVPPIEPIMHDVDVVGMHGKEGREAGEDAFGLFPGVPVELNWDMFYVDTDEDSTSTPSSSPSEDDTMDDMGNVVDPNVDLDRRSPSPLYGANPSSLNALNDISSVGVDVVALFDMLEDGEGNPW
jgi:hypothetical protein